jgi:hypothetical protein
MTENASKGIVALSECMIHGRKVTRSNRCRSQMPKGKVELSPLLSAQIHFENGSPGGNFPYGPAELLFQWTQLTGLMPGILREARTAQAVPKVIVSLPMTVLAMTWGNTVSQFDAEIVLRLSHCRRFNFRHASH